MAAGDFSATGERRKPRFVIRASTATILLVGVLAAIATLHFQPFEYLHRLSEANRRGEFEEWILVAMIICITAIVLATVRGAELKAQIRIGEESERFAHRLARFDQLTGLPNRRGFIEHVDGALRRRHADRSVAVLLIDLDRFKPVNDLYGHESGDGVLVEIGKRFASIAASHQSAIVARMGGDEFACAIEYDSGGDAPTLFANAAINLARMPIVTNAATVTIGASVGIAIQVRRVDDTAELLRMADRAMYQAKEAGRNAARMFDSAMDARARAATRLEAEIRRGIARREFVPFYQPIAELSTGLWRGFECLARWNHPGRGLLEADQFITVAENADLMDSLSLLLLDQACAEAADWPAHFTLSFNISPMQLRNAWLPQQILRTLTDHGIAPGRLIIELTESGLFADLDVARSMIASLKNAGVKLALDDFGTGYSSLSHLAQLPFDIIKIDRSFIENIDVEAQDSIVTAIIRMGHSLGMKVTAEGVTSERNWRSLKALGCDRAQGFMIGRPESAATTAGKIAQRSAAVAFPARKAANQ
jgi:diguanylate cyclase (GGDEF)-like protein